MSREKDIEEEDKEVVKEAAENSKRSRRKSSERVSRYYNYISPKAQAVIDEVNKHSPGIQTRRRH